MLPARLIRLGADCVTHPTRRGVLRTNREDYATTGRTPRARSRPTPINIGILVSTVLRVIIGKATTITTLISTPRSEDFQSIEGSIYTNRWPTKLRVCRRRTYRGTCTKFHGAPIHRTPAMRAYRPLDDRYAKCAGLHGSQTIRSFQ